MLKICILGLSPSAMAIKAGEIEDSSVHERIKEEYSRTKRCPTSTDYLVLVQSIYSKKGLNPKQIATEFFSLVLGSGDPLI